MAELALIAGMNYFGNEPKKIKISSNKKTNDQIIMDDHRKTPYHTESVNRTNKEYKELHQQRRNSMDSGKYMIPSYYVHEDGDMELGMENERVNNGDVENEQSFLDQFELQKVSNKKIKAKNESGMSCLTSKWSTFEDGGDDMTLGVIPKDDAKFKHNNMEAFNRMRDMADPDYEDNRPLEMFTGYSETYKSKKEMGPLFKPTKNSTVGHGSSALSSMTEERFQDVIGIRRNGDKPFESRQVGPGLNLDEDQDNMGGFRDSTRIMPIVGDALRRADNPKISYEPPIIQGKKGTKRPVMAKFERRREDQFETDRDMYASGGIKGQRNNDVINLNISNRTFSEPVIGPKGGNYSTFDPKRQGKIKESTKKVYDGQVGVASGTGKKIQQNLKSIHINEQQRQYTNYEYQGATQGKQRGAVIDTKTQVKGKQLLASQQRSAPNRSQGQVAFNSQQQIKGKQQLAEQQRSAPNRAQGQITFDPHQQIKGKQQLANQQRSAPNRAQGQVAFNSQQQVKGKQQLAEQQRSAPNRAQGQITFDPHQQVKGKQQLANQQRSAPNRAQGQITFDPHQQVKGKQQLANQQRSAPNRAQGQITVNPHDTAKQTLKQGTVQMDRSTFIHGGKTKHKSELQDDVRTTMNQDLVYMPRSTFVGGHDANYTGLQDDVRNTMKQDIVQYSTIGGATVHTNQGYILDKSEAPITLKQLTNYNNHIAAAGSNAINTNNPVDTNIYYAPTTLKQRNNVDNYMGGANNSYQTADQSAMYNARLNENKDTVLQGREPTRGGVSAIPTADNMGFMSVPDNHSYEYVPPANQHGLQYDPNMNIMNVNIPSYGDNIGNYNTMETNPYNIEYGTWE